MIFVDLLSGSNFSIAAFEMRAGRPAAAPLDRQPIATINLGFGKPYRPELTYAVCERARDSVIIQVRGAGLAAVTRVTVLGSGLRPRPVPYAILSDSALVAVLSADAGRRVTMIHAQSANNAGSATAVDVAGLLRRDDPRSLLAILAPGESAEDLATVDGVESAEPAIRGAILPSRTGRDADLSRIVEIKLRAGAPIAAVLDAVRARPGVVSADSGSSGPEPHAPPNDPYLTEQWQLAPVTGTFCTGTITPVSDSDINADRTWQMPEFSAASNIAIIDTGVDMVNDETDYFDFNCQPASFVDTPDNIDEAQHGTAVASIAAARTNNAAGIASTSRQGGPVALKIFGPGQSGGWSETLSALNRVRNDNRLPVANLSFGGYESDPTQLRSLRVACKSAFLRDRILVASAGNLHRPNPSYPAAIDAYVLAVGAVLWNNNYWTIQNGWPASNDTLNGSAYGSWVDLVAPGGMGITAAKPGEGPAGPYMYSLSGTDPITRCDLSYCSYGLTLCDAHSAFGGTSAAAPFVSGAASFIRQFKPTLTAEDVVEILKRTATDLGAPGVDVFFGNGRVNLGAAVQKLTDEWVEHGVVGNGASVGMQILADSVTNAQITLTNAVVNGITLNGTFTFPCVKYHLAAQLQFSADFVLPPVVWVRRATTLGLPDTVAWNHDADVSWAGMPQVSASSAVVETYVYRLTKLNNAFYPGPPSDAKVSYTALGPTGVLGAPPVARREGSALSLRPSTNPSRGGVRFEATGLADGPIRVEIFDLLGRKTAILREGRSIGDKASWHWAGLGQDGDACPPGIYVCRIEQPGHRSACRFAYLR